MAKIIAISNQKGGVGKTTTSVNLAAALVALRKHVMLIDLDPQGNATMGSGIDKSQVEFTVTDLLLQNQSIGEVLLDAPAEYMLIPANKDTTVAEVSLLAVEEGRESRLKQALAPIENNFDYILIDCPPTLNTLTLNALVAANSVIIPMQCEYYALEGLAGLLETIDQVRSSVNPELELEGVLRTMYDGRNRLAVEVSEQLMEHFGDKLFDTIIPRNVRLAEAPSHGLPILQYDKRSLGAAAYLNLASELRKRERKQKRQSIQKQSHPVEA